MCVIAMRRNAISACSMRLLFGLFLGITGQVYAVNQADDPIDYARHRLGDPNAGIRWYALSIVAKRDPKAERERLFAALKDPSPDVQMVGLVHLRDVPLGKDSVKVHEYLEKAAAEVKAAFAAHSEAAEPFIWEMSAIEVLLAAGDANDRLFAQDYIRHALAEPSNLTRWLMMAELIGKYKLNDLVPLLKSNIPSKEPHPMLALDLAKLDDKEAIELLRRSLNVPQWRAAVLRDAELVKILGLKEQDILPSLKSTSFDEKVAAATALARFGNRDPLRKLLSDVWLPELREEDHEKRFQRADVLASIGDVGDETFLPQLMEYFNKSENEALKLSVAYTITQISARQTRKGEPIRDGDGRIE